MQPAQLRYAVCIQACAHCANTLEERGGAEGIFTTTLDVQSRSQLPIRVTGLCSRNGGKSTIAALASQMFSVGGLLGHDPDTDGREAGALAS